MLFPSNPSFSPRGPRCYHSPDATLSCSIQVRPLRRTQCRVNVTTSTANKETSKSVYVKRSLATSLPTLFPQSFREESLVVCNGDRLTRPHFPRCRLPTCCRTAVERRNALLTCRNRLAGSSTGSDAARLFSSSASPKPSACSSMSVRSAATNSTRCSPNGTHPPRTLHRRRTRSIRDFLRHFCREGGRLRRSAQHRALLRLRYRLRHHRRRSGFRRPLVAVLHHRLHDLQGFPAAQGPVLREPRRIDGKESHSCV
jgi:hypothetical protein